MLRQKSGGASDLARWLIALTVVCVGVMLSRRADAGKTVGGSPKWELPRKWSASSPKKGGKQCTLPPTADGAGEDLPSRVSFDGENVELAHGNDVFRLSWDAAGQLSLLDVTSVGGKILDIRATPDRAYLVGKHPHQKTDLGVVLLGQTMQLDGQHDVADWVESEQSVPYRVRVTKSGSVEVVWLAQ